MFRIGDMVKIVKLYDEYSEQVKLGEIYTVTDITDNSHVYIHIPGDDLYIVYHHQLEKQKEDNQQ